MKRICLLVLFVALGQFALITRADLASIFTNTAPVHPKAIPHRASIIYIQCHDLAPGDLSCYGQTNYQTPNLDRLAKNGIRFTHYTGGVESSATTAMLLSGKTSAFAPGSPNLLTWLNQSGYRTGLFGEWGLAGTPWDAGSVEFDGFLHDAEGRNYYSDYVWRYAPNYDLKGNSTGHPDFEGREAVYQNLNGKKGSYIPDFFVKAMLNFVRGNQPDFVNHYRPFFLLLNFSAPRTAVAGKDVFPVPTDAPYNSETWPQAARNRAALITRLDDGVGQLLEQLKKQGMTNNVAIFFSSSCVPEKFANPAMNFMLPKNEFRDQKTIVPPTLPLLAYWPGTIPPGQVCDEPVTAADFAPTALEIGYAETHNDLPGHTLLPLLKGQKPEKKPAPKPEPETTPKH